MANRKIFLLILLLAVSAAAALVIGPVSLTRDILWLRLSRILLGIAAGAGLASCGAVFQALLRNPLAEPYVLGVSSGAGLGAVLAVALFGYAGFLPLPAFTGGLLVIFLVYNLSRVGQKVPVQTLLLSGVVINIICSSLILFFISASGNPVLHDAMWWLLGNLQVFDSRLVLASLAAAGLGIPVFMLYSRELDAISLGEEEALHLGINIENVKTALFIIASIITAALVSACGLIGFVGLIVPHMARAIVGPKHKALIITAAILGAIFLVLSDAAARTIMKPAEIPIGIITSLLGGPFFLYLLRKTRNIKQK
ncbi:MAG: iron ABC transporter permease [Candidatus Omnitrophica bacterium]|nr:iron ABC transporter permease [Candidatus Omnitrophota bacterium]